MAWRTFSVARDEVDLTVAAFLKGRLGCSWAEAKGIVARGGVRVARQKVTDPAARLKIGKMVEVEDGLPSTDRSSEKRPEPPPKPKPRVDTPRPSERYQGPEPVIRYQDDQIVVVDKPINLTTMRHPEEAAEFGRGKRFLPVTLADLLPELLGRPTQKLRAVHRIDKDTTGLVVFARNATAEANLTEQFRKHTIHRRYLALTRGTPKAGRVESTLVAERGDGRRGSGSAADASAQKAVTYVKVLEELGELALVECRLETGRTHQVRIHLGELGTPLCGERIYDRPLHGRPFADPSGASRTALHAAQLGLTHPETGSWIEWESALPADMAGWLEAARQAIRFGRGDDSLV